MSRVRRAGRGACMLAAALAIGGAIASAAALWWLAIISGVLGILAVCAGAGAPPEPGLEALIDATREPRIPDHVPDEWVREAGR